MCGFITPGFQAADENWFGYCFSMQCQNVNVSTSVSRMNSSYVRKNNNVGDEHHKSTLFGPRQILRCTGKEQNGLRRIFQKSSTPRRDTLQTFPQGSALFTSTWPDASKSITETTGKRLTEWTSSLIYSESKHLRTRWKSHLNLEVNKVKWFFFFKCYDMKKIYSI